jgi:hypothetical protein
MLGQNPGWQLQQIIEITNGQNGQEAEVLVKNDPRQLRFFFHRSKRIRGRYFCRWHANRFYLKKSPHEACQHKWPLDR